MSLFDSLCRGNWIPSAHGQFPHSPLLNQMRAMTEDEYQQMSWSQAAGMRAMTQQEIAEHQARMMGLQYSPLGSLPQGYCRSFVEHKSDPDCIDLEQNPDGSLGVKQTKLIGDGK